jgi:hypothetical protein
LIHALAIWFAERGVFVFARINFAARLQVSRGVFIARRAVAGKTTVAHTISVGYAFGIHVDSIALGVVRAMVDCIAHGVFALIRFVTGFAAAVVGQTGGFQILAIALGVRILIKHTLLFVAIVNVFASFFAIGVNHFAIASRTDTFHAALLAITRCLRVAIEIALVRPVHENRAMVTFLNSFHAIIDIDARTVDFLVAGVAVAGVAIAGRLFWFVVHAPSIRPTAVFVQLAGVLFAAFTFTKVIALLAHARVLPGKNSLINSGNVHAGIRAFLAAPVVFASVNVLAPLLIEKVARVTSADVFATTNILARSRSADSRRADGLRDAHRALVVFL